MMFFTSIQAYAQKSDGGAMAYPFEKANFESVPWDTVTAKIQIVRATAAPDSVVLANIQHILKSYGITKDLYQQFYLKFHRQSVEQQSDFLMSVQKIIQALLEQASLTF